VNVSSTLTNTTIWFVAALSLIVDVRIYVRTYGRTFLPGLLGHLGGVDVINGQKLQGGDELGLNNDLDGLWPMVI